MLQIKKESNLEINIYNLFYSLKNIPLVLKKNNKNHNSIIVKFNNLIFLLRNLIKLKQKQKNNIPEINKLLKNIYLII